MALVLSGTDNSVSSPAVQGGTGGTSTGIYYPASNQLALATNGTQALLVDSSQNVGVGTAPSVKFEVSSTAVAVARLGSSQTSPNNILMTGGSSANYGVIGVNTGNNTSSGDVFQLGYTASAGAAPTSVLQWSSAAKCIGLNTTPATSGTGITFPATQSASTDVNTLDDYEEGTWTPAGNGITFTSVQGLYTKIGNLVIANFQVAFPSTANGNGAQITGLPFTTNTNCNNASTGITDYGSSNIIAYIGGGGTVIRFRNYSNADLTNANLSTKFFYGVAVYLV